MDQRAACCLLTVYPGDRQQPGLLEIDMDFDKAVEIMEAKLARRGGSMFDLAVEMQADLEAGNLDNRDAAAIRSFMRNMRKLFIGD
jgi:hypothetical protein